LHKSEGLKTRQKHLRGKYAFRLKKNGQVAFGGYLAFFLGGEGPQNENK